MVEDWRSTRIVELEWQWTNCLHVLQREQWRGAQLMWSADTGEFLVLVCRLPSTARAERLRRIAARLAAAFVDADPAGNVVGALTG